MVCRCEQRRYTSLGILSLNATFEAYGQNSHHSWCQQTCVLSPTIHNEVIYSLGTLLLHENST